MQTPWSSTQAASSPKEDHDHRLQAAEERALMNAI